MENVLFIFTDQWRADCMGYRNHPVVKTPNLDKLAQKSVDFKNSFTTTPLCTPARGSLLTGLYPHQSGIIDNCDVGGSSQEYLPGNAFTWLDAMAKSGRKTGYFGKWHLGLDWDGSNSGVDFDICRKEGNRAKHMNGIPFVTERGQLIKDRGERFVPEKNGNKLPFYGKIDSVENRYEHKVTTKVLDFLEANKDQPWCLTASFVGPHFPSILPEPYFSMYPPAEMVLPENITDTFFNKPWFHSRNWWPSVATDDFTAENWQKTISAYYGCITMMDALIGEILDKAAACSGGRPTKVIFTSDHGEMLGGHARFDKDAYFYEEVLRTPLLYCANLNGDQGGFARDDYATTLDIAQTFFGLAGFGAENGSSLTPMLDKSYQPDAEKIMFGNYYKYNGHSFEIRFARTPRYKYSFIPQDIDELYDMENDPQELVNLSDRAQYQDIKEELKARVLQHMKDTNDYLLDVEKLPEAGTIKSVPYPPIKTTWEM
ncbi:sulfatase-like hydrolase/transferase [Candidatus Epulonipiscium viviparus]|uniref:sulfatase-like hydrolase/transferase n=1 Tax=Candidatus Epulonipiscium viviparus TaxID=420336 RepID=UPI00273810BC|nr:sulfatase-like hydrolase/transferase [Candidatus Epulopiscium viviparus]